MDCSDVFHRSVLEAFRTGYLEGITPNPCIQCNSIVKFGAMVDYARSVTDFDLFATGHYARVREGNGRYELLKAKDTRKDQSYFLSRLSQRQLSSVVFPLGDYTKDEIRTLRLRLHLSLGLFAELLGVSEKTVEAWESGHNEPSGPALRLMNMIQRYPDVLMETHTVYITK